MRRAARRRSGGRRQGCTPRAAARGRRRNKDERRPAAGGESAGSVREHGGISWKTESDMPDGGPSNAPFPAVRASRNQPARKGELVRAGGQREPGPRLLGLRRRDGGAAWADIRRPARQK